MDSSEDKNTFQCPWITVKMRPEVRCRRHRCSETETAGAAGAWGKTHLGIDRDGWCVGDLFRCLGDRLVVVHMFRARLHVGVSKNKGAPKSSILIGFSIINHPFWVPLFLETPMYQRRGVLSCFIINKFSYWSSTFFMQVPLVEIGDDILKISQPVVEGWSLPQ